MSLYNESHIATPLGKTPIPKLLLQQSIPASIGILVMSLNILIDSVFMGRWIGVYAMGAIQVVLPISFLIATLGMAIGVGGSSILSRALGENNLSKALYTFGNQITLTLCSTVLLSSFALYYSDTILPFFGGKGHLFSLAKTYYEIILLGIPFLGLSMMGNTVIRAEGKPTFAMIAMILPTIMNLIMDYHPPSQPIIFLISRILQER